LYDTLVSRSDLPVYRDFKEVLGRYDRKSLAALGFLLLSQVCVGVYIRDLIARNPWMWSDKLLGLTWLAMTLLLMWDIRPRRDVLLVLVGLAGGLVVEWWGTQTRLWEYFTTERPPPWIIPSWAVAALAIDRLGRMFTPFIPVFGDTRVAYWGVFSSFILMALIFMRTAFGHASSWVVLAIMLFALFWRPTPPRDLCIFFGGSLLGFLLEYWGTSRHCWTYYTRQVPPTITVLAHGYASVIFSRTIQVLEDAAAKLI